MNDFIINELEKIVKNYRNRVVIIEWSDKLRVKVKILSFDMDDNLYENVIKNGEVIEITEEHEEYREWSVINVKIYNFLYIPEVITSFKGMDRNNIGLFGYLEITELNIPEKISLVDNDEIIWDWKKKKIKKIQKQVNKI